MSAKPSNVVDLPVHRYRNLYLIGHEDGRRLGRLDAERRYAASGFVVGIVFVSLLMLLIRALT
jgi:hypothetical protein